MKKALFGPSGNPESFYAGGGKASQQMPAWLAGLGLGAYEYSLTRGVNISEATARAIGDQAVLHGIAMSLHAPYYISLASEEETTAANTTRHLLKSMEAAAWLRADRIAFHPGGIGKLPRRDAMELAKRRLSAILEEADRLGMTEVKLAAETHGKANQLGTLEEVLEFCKLSPQIVPLVDFAHLYAVAGGGYATEAEYSAVFDRIGEALGAAAAQNLHIHFSSIEFTKGGEKRHGTFRDAFGPPYQPLSRVIANAGLTPRIICESAGTQSEDALAMQEFYRALWK